MDVGPSHFDRLSDEVALTIFSHLRPKTLATCERVHSRWSRLSDDESLWKRLYLRQFGYDQRNLHDAERTWKSRFTLAYRWSKGLCKCHMTPLSATESSDIHLRCALELEHQRLFTDLKHWWQSYGCSSMTAFALDQRKGGQKAVDLNLAIASGHMVRIYQIKPSSRHIPELVYQIRVPSLVQSLAVYSDLIVVLDRLRLTFYRLKEDGGVESIATLRSIGKTISAKIKIEQHPVETIHRSLKVSLCSIMAGRLNTVSLTEINVDWRSSPRLPRVTLGETWTSDPPRIVNPQTKRTFYDMQTGSEAAPKPTPRAVDIDFEYPWIVVGTADNAIKIYKIPLINQFRSLWKEFLPVPPLECMGKDADPGDSVLTLQSTLYGHTAGITSIHIRNGRCVSTARDGTIRIWDLAPKLTSLLTPIRSTVTLALPSPLPSSDSPSTIPSTITHIISDDEKITAIMDPGRTGEGRQTLQMMCLSFCS